MNSLWHEIWLRLTDTTAPGVPALWLTQAWLRMGWGVVLACLGVALLRRWSLHPVGRIGVAALLMCWALLPGAMSPAYWLGLAFQAPSVAGVAMAAACLLRMLRRARKQHWHVVSPAFPWMAGVWVLLGWALLADTFAQMPWEMYRWGFSPLATGAFLVLALLPWLIRGSAIIEDAWIRAALLGAVGGAMLGLPSGNVWDAVLDPWLWVAAHVAIFHTFRRRRSADS
jgi:hypothetical protein